MIFSLRLAKNYTICSQLSYKQMSKTFNKDNNSLYGINEKDNTLSGSLKKLIYMLGFNPKL